MTEKNRKDHSPEIPGEVEGVLKAIEDSIRAGSIPEDLVRLSNSAQQEKLLAILAQLVATRQFSLALANGDLSQDLAVRGYLAGSLKTLQSNLRHLTWQAGQIAGGDLTQRVRFMGDFSDSFNTMVERLADNQDERDRREKDLFSLNAALTSEIAERKKTEDALRQANKKITLLSGITRHDINNQLQVLRAYIELSQQKTRDPQLLEYILREDRAAAMIGNQIAFTKTYENIGVEAPVWQNVQHCICTAAREINLTGIGLNAGEMERIEVFADPLLQKVFFNLFDNSLRHGGDAMTRIQFSYRRNDQDLTIFFRDDGNGISSGEKEMIFERGYGKNTGFGLFFIREVLAITGIVIRETGEPGKGACFEIIVPKDGYRFVDPGTSE